MINLKNCFEEVKNVGKYLTLGDCSFVIYKGFKVTKFDNGSYKLEDTRRSDFYSDLLPQDVEAIIDLGYIKGIDYIYYKNNLRRLKDSERRIENLYNKKIELKNNTKIDKQAYDKNLAIYNKNINENIDLMFLCKSRVGQYKN